MQGDTVRYHATDRRGRGAFIVEDGAGRACLVCGGRLQAYLGSATSADPAGRLAALLAGSATWTPVSPPRACTDEGLCPCDSAAAEAH